MSAHPLSTIRSGLHIAVANINASQPCVTQTLTLQHGVKKNSGDLRVTLSSVNGFISPGPISRSTAVGAFGFTGLSMNPEARAGEATEIYLNLSMTMPLEVGEEIAVHLPHFIASNLSAPL